MTYSIYPTSVLVEDPTSNKTVVLEQQYEYDLLSSSNLLNKYLKNLITGTGFAGTNYTGKLLINDENDVVLKRNDGSVVDLGAIKIEFPNSSWILTKPILVWHIYSPTSGKRDLIISYLNKVLSWSVLYRTNECQFYKCRSQYWVSISNKLGFFFDNKRLKLAIEICTVSASKANVLFLLGFSTFYATELVGNPLIKERGVS